MQNTVLSGRHALAFLLSHRAKGIDEDFEISQNITRSSANFMAYLPGSINFDKLLRPIEGRPRVSKKESQQIAELLGVQLPLNVVVDSSSNRRNSDRLRCSVLPEGLSGDFCFVVSDELYCCIPELALLQVAKECSDVELIITMSLLFGVFAKHQETKGLVPRRSLTTPEAVRAFLSRCKEDCSKVPDGIARIEALLPFAIVNAASPKEIECAMRLGYDISRGGCGFGLPEMNYRLDIPSTKRSRYCDLYWPEQNVAVEYFGAEEHSGMDALEADALHSNDLTSIDVPVFSITAGQLYNLSSFNRVARQIERRLHQYRKLRERRKKQRGFPASATFHDKQRALKAEIDAAFRTFGF